VVDDNAHYSEHYRKLQVQWHWLLKI